MSQMSRYCYQPLGKDEIRLLTLKPHSLSENLLISIQKFQLSTVKNEYEALSYTWGDATVLHHLQCSNGNSLNITSNLHDALCDLRLETEPRKLWIDAVCIDQENFNERGEQVSIMRQIYQSSKKTIAYVGKEADNSSLAISYMNDLFERLRQRIADLMNLIRADPSTLGQMPDFDPQNLVVDSMKTLGANGEDPFGGFNVAATQKATVSFLARPWFRRVWVIQEFVVSPEVELVCGKQTCEYSSFMTAFSYAFENSQVAWSGAIAASQRKDFCQGLAQMLKLTERRINFQKQTSSGPPLLGLLKEYRTSLATIANDKVYALTALSGDQAHLKPDYSSSKEDLYLQVAKDLIDSGRGENVLAEAARSDRMKSPDMPSWVPDWSEAPTRTDFSDIITASGWFFKAGGEESPTAPKATFEHRGRVLRTKGVIIHTVAVLGGENPDRVKGKPNISILMSIMRHIQTFQEQFPRIQPPPARYPTGEDITTVAAAILLAGQSSHPTAFGKVHKDYAHDIMVEFELENPTDDDMDASAIELIRELYKDTPYGVRNMSRAVWGRSLCISFTAAEVLYWGLVPATARRGDKVCVLRGCAVPYVLREVAGGRYVLVGDCYVHGVMQGEAVEGGLEMRDIEII